MGKRCVVVRAEHTLNARRLNDVAAFDIQYPNTSYITTTNAPSGGTGNLGASASRCSSEYGRAPTFIVVDFFNVGPAIETVDGLNGVTNPVGRATVSEEVMGTSSAATTSAAATVTTLPHRYALMLCLTFLAITLDVV